MANYVYLGRCACPCDCSEIVEKHVDAPDRRATHKRTYRVFDYRCKRCWAVPM